VGAFFIPSKTQLFLLSWQAGSSRLLFQPKALFQFQTAHKHQNIQKGGNIVAIEILRHPRVEVYWPVTLVTETGSVIGFLF